MVAHVCFLLAVAALVALPSTQAQLVTQFDIAGTIQELKVLPNGPLSNSLLAGGFIVVNDIRIIIPDNTVIVFPAAYWTLPQVVQKNPNAAGVALGETGLALEDTTYDKRKGSFEAQIQGNIVNDVYIAGNIHISPDSLQNSDGYIRAVNFATGEICFGSSPAPLASGVACVQPNIRMYINDPTGQYGKTNAQKVAATPSISFDERFQVDSDNPTIMAATSYPMCVPRSASDELCPIGNRPLLSNIPVSTFVMTGSTPLATPDGVDIPTCPSFFLRGVAPTGACDPSKQAPLMPGDFISVSGVPYVDSLGNRIFLATSIDANVGIYTAKGTAPFYISFDEEVIGAGPQNCAPNSECQTRVRVVGLTTDPSRVGPGLNFLNFYYLDVDNSGVRRTRLMQSISTSLARNVFQKQGFYGRWRLDLTKKDSNNVPPTSGGPSGFGGLTRELLVRLEPTASALGDGTILPTGPTAANGLVYGQYWAPMPEYVFPEPKLPGARIAGANFNCLTHAVNGWALDLANTGAITRIPPLSPWPGKAASSGVNCARFLE